MRQRQDPIVVRWEGGMRYRGGPPGGPTLLLDGERKEAPSPVQTVLVALASCSAIDVVEILEKRRTPPETLEVQVEFERAGTHPRRLVRVHLAFHVTAPGEPKHVERAIELSLEKYCSVSASLAPDTEIDYSLKMVDPSAVAGEGDP